MKVQKKPIQVEAVRLNNTQEDIDEILSWSTKKRPIVIVRNDDDVDYAEIKTLEGTMRADKGDWIIKGVEGEVYPCKDRVFIKTYDIIIDQNTKIIS